MTTQPEAPRLADALEISSNHGMRREAAAELRRLVAQRDALLEVLRGYVNDYMSEDGLYDAKHYVKTFSAAIKAAEENT